jgi:GTP-binding protein HflX
VLNKIDTVGEEELAEKQEALSALAPNPVTISAREGTNVDRLRGRVDSELPDWRRERLVAPMTDDTMSLVSWIHDHANVESVDYGDQVVVDFEARPEIVEQARDRASELAAAPAE